MELVVDFIPFGKLKDKNTVVLNCQTIMYISLIPSVFQERKTVHFETRNHPFSMAAGLIFFTPSYYVISGIPDD
jgi:hypothetical protein